MCVLLAFGVVVGAARQPELLSRLAEAPIGFKAPTWPLAQTSWNQVFVGVALLALPQIPLTLGSAVIAIAA